MNTAILDLAKAAGLAHEWTNAFGKPMQVSEDALRDILDKLGFPCATDEQCRDSEARLLSLQAGGDMPPLLTGTVGQPVQFPLHQRFAGKSFRITLEEGGHVDGRLPDDLGGGAVLPPIDRYGYHRLTVDGPGAETTLAIAPGQCFGVSDALAGAGAAQSADPRLWGLGVQLYSLRRHGDGGIG
ncbi:MAG TPA: 4-alpha-glucanotransferase, partial [Noviherbaspirillum sp.]|nr:4-alpha-glucanotransferase [Noviherbaspirillum sp.]